MIKIKLHGSIRIGMLDGAIKSQDFHLHTQFLLQFASYTVIELLTRLAFSTGEFPVAAERRRFKASSDQIPVFLLDEGNRNLKGGLCAFHRLKNLLYIKIN
jgi:hypothetical protein